MGVAGDAYTARIHVLKSLQGHMYITYIIHVELLCNSYQY